MPDTSHREDPGIADLPLALTPLAAVAWIATRCVALTLAAGPGGSIRNLLWLGLKWRESQPREEQDRWPDEHARYAAEREQRRMWAAEPERWKRLPKNASKAKMEAWQAERRALRAAWEAREPTVTPADVPDPVGAALAQLDLCARAGRLPASAVLDGHRQVIPPEAWPELTVAVVTVGRLEALDVCEVITTGPTGRPCAWTAALFDRDRLLQLYPAHGQDSVPEEPHAELPAQEPVRPAEPPPEDQDHSNRVGEVAKVLQRLHEGGVISRSMNREEQRQAVREEMKMESLSERTLSRALNQLGWTRPRRQPPR